MGCKQRTVKIAKRFAQMLTPIAVRYIADTVGILEGTDWSNDEKREIAVTLGRSRLNQLGLDAKEGAIRVAVEVAVDALKEGADALGELGDDDSATPITETV